MWFLDESIAQQIDKARASGMQFTADERAELVARSSEFGKVKITGNTAIIPIEGVLTEKFDLIAAFFGGGNTTYLDVARSLKEADASDDVKEIVLAVNSGGGNVNGMFAAMDAIKGTQKPTTAIVRNVAASAAFGLASQADKVVASNRGTQLGSVGVAYDTVVFDGDIKEVSITSTEAPDKRPNLLTEDGQAVIRDQLDDIHSLFAGAIADGRDTTVKDVNKNYGRGAIVLAEDALKRGMIDSIGVDNDKPKQTANGGKTAEVRSMDLTQLKTEHPAVYAAAVEVGKTEERERVCAHLTMGEAAEALEIAHAAIKDGAEMTASLTADYNAAILKRSAIASREADNQDITPPAEPKTPTAEDKLDKEIVAAMGAEDGEGVWL